MRGLSLTGTQTVDSTLILDLNSVEKVLFFHEN